MSDVGNGTIRNIIDRLARMEEKVDNIKEDLLKACSDISEIVKMSRNEMLHFEARIAKIEKINSEGKGKSDLIDNWIKPVIIAATIFLLIEAIKFASGKGW